MSKRMWSASGLVAVIACAVASAAIAGDGAGGNGAKVRDRTARRVERRERLQEGAARRRAAAMHVLESLQATDEQRALVLDRAKAAAPILSEARRQARALVAQAMASGAKAGSKADRRAARASVKAQLQTIRAEARGQVDTLAKDVVASLTPEQRQKLSDVAAKRGRTLDDARLTRLAAALISRPTTAAYLEARQPK